MENSPISGCHREDFICAWKLGDIIVFDFVDFVLKNLIVQTVSAGNRIAVVKEKVGPGRIIIFTVPFIDFRLACDANLAR